MNNKNITVKETLVLAYQNHKKNKLKIAENLYKKVLKINPNHFETIFLLGSLLVQTKNFNASKQLLQKAVQIQPNNTEALNNLGAALKEMGEYQQAIDCYKKVIQIQPHHKHANRNLGLAFQGLGEFKKAVDCCQKAIQIQPKRAVLHGNLGKLYVILGDIQKAINCYRKAVRYESKNLFYYYILGDLEKKTLDIHLKNKIGKIMQSTNPTKLDLAYGNFLLSRYESQTKNYKSEFNYLLKGHHYFFDSENEKYKKEVEFWLDKLPKTQELISLNKTDNNIKKSNFKIKPIFIIGVPRCGSTLVEKIIASGNRYIPIGEETAIISTFINQRILENQLSKLNKKNLQEKLLERYKKKELVQEKSNYTFTDKSLENFFYLGLIKEIFPYAKVINCRRTPLSSIMSIFKSNLPGYAWAHNLEHIFKYFDIYYKIIENFKKFFPNFIYELQYEKLVDNPKMESKKLMEFCDLPWDKKCLEFYKRKDLVSKTSSNVQIRKAIYKNSIQKYLPYKQLLNKYGNEYQWFN